MTSANKSPKIHALTLATWFAANRRDLPWRREVTSGETYAGRDPLALRDPLPIRDPYRTWISEIMLQQTQVKTVIEYFNHWMDRFPTLEKLAEAEEKDILEAWAGLGYYSRARNVLAAARTIMQSHGGRFPWRRDDLLALNGIGEYTAGAIASLAFNRPEPILDGNVVRVFSRVYGLEFLPDTKPGKQAYWDLARQWANSHSPSLVNEGLMELGALVCTPRNPQCQLCPLEKKCTACILGKQCVLPPVRIRKDVEDFIGFAVLVFRNWKSDKKTGGDVLMYTPTKPERLASLLTFPVLPAADFSALQSAWVASFPAFGATPLSLLRYQINHSITHHRYHLQIAQGWLNTSFNDLPKGYEWVPVDEVEKVLVSSLPLKIWRKAITEIRD